MSAEIEHKAIHADVDLLAVLAVERCQVCREWWWRMTRCEKTQDQRSSQPAALKRCRRTHGGLPATLKSRSGAGAAAGAAAAVAGAAMTTFLVLPHEPKIR
jgi:hypothetical protein